MRLLEYQTAGGVVLNEEGELLVLARTVKRDSQPVEEWRLPKGHIDPGETDAEAAVREVGVESGYWNATIIGDLGRAHSGYVLDDARIERDEHYFLMRTTRDACGEQQPVSDEEALFIPHWVPLATGPTLLTYPTEQEMAVRAIAFLAAERPS